MKNKKIILWTVIISFILSLILIQLVSKKLNPSILRYSTIEAKRFGTYVVNFSLDKEFLSELDNDIFKITKNDENEIQMIDFDVKKVNNLLENVTTKVQNRLIMLENGKIDDMELANTFQGLRYKKIKKGVVCELPAGILYSNALLSNNGPVVPIKLN